MPPSGKRIKIRASNRLASISHSYAYIAGHGSALIKSRAPQRVYTASQQLQELCWPADPQQRLHYVRGRNRYYVSYVIFVKILEWKILKVFLLKIFM
jgi:hypothetical protein